MTRRLSSVFWLAAIGLATLTSGSARAAVWKTNVVYGGSTIMDLYIPDRLAASPAVVVSLHYCGGTAANAHSWFQGYADLYGFAIIAPGAGGNCFDATPARSGERAAITQMVQYVVTQYGANPARVFAAGASSGACMTQALLAAYPDVFAAGSSLAGVPAGAWTAGNNYGWSTPASTTAQQWGDKVRQADAGFAGTRPRVQLWQGMGDTTLTYSQNYPAEVAQWTNVFAVTTADATSQSIRPPGAQDTWARDSYKNGSGIVVVEANSGPASVPHDLTGRGLWPDVVRFFGLDQTSSGSDGGTDTGGSGTGGSTPGTGGSTPGTGGSVAGTGGSTPGTGGMIDSSGTGGMLAGTGGDMGTGGTDTPAGTGGSDMTGVGGAETGAPSGDGCSCNVGSGRSASAITTLLLVAVGLTLRRRGRARAGATADLRTQR